MKGLFIILFLTPLVFLLHGQKVTFQWAKQMRGSDPVGSRGFAVGTDASGNVYTTGLFKGRVDFDPGPGIYSLDPLGTDDIYISKLDSAGTFLWVKQMDVISSAAITAKSKAIAIDAAGNVFITGDFSDGNLRRKCFVSKLDPSGNPLWTKQLGESSSGSSIKVDGGGNVYTAGLCSGQSDFDPGPGVFNIGDFGSMLFVSKLDLNGNFIWAKEIKGYQFGNGIYGQISDEASIDLDGLNNICISGSFFGIVDFDPGAGLFNLSSTGNTGAKDIFVLKLATDGSFLWAKQMGGIDVDLGISVAADGSGNIYTAGNFRGTADFDPGSDVYNLIAGNGAPNTFISKLDGSGNFIWARQVVGDLQWCYSATLDKSANLYITGYFASTLDFDPGPGIYNLSPTGFDVFVSKINTDGNFVWAKQLEGAGTIIANSIVVDTWGDVYTTGYFFSGQVDFDPGPGTFYLTSADGDNIFVHKMGQCLNNTFFAITASACRNYTLNGQTYNTSGVNTQTLTNAAGCDSIITLHLTIATPLFTTIAQSICAGQSFNGHSANGIYIDTLVADNGCDSIIKLQLTVLPDPSPYLGIDTSLCVGDSLVLYPGKFTTYTWQDGSATDHITIRKPGSYSVAVTDNCGSATDEIIIKEGICGIYFPTAFTPNNDGLNDLFKILWSGNLTEYHLSVYNRWGQKVFETFDYSKGWNGSFNGQIQSSQTFVWSCQFKRQGDAKRIKKKGIVTLIR